MKTISKTAALPLDVPMEAPESRVARSSYDPEARSPVLQVYRLHGDLRHVQTVWDARIHRPQYRGPESDGQQEE